MIAHVDFCQSPKTAFAHGHFASQAFPLVSKKSERLENLVPLTTDATGSPHRARSRWGTSRSRRKIFEYRIRNNVDPQAASPGSEVVAADLEARRLNLSIRAS